MKRPASAGPIRVASPSGSVVLCTNFKLKKSPSTSVIDLSKELGDTAQPSTSRPSRPASASSYRVLRQPNSMRENNYSRIPDNEKYIRISTSPIPLSSRVGSPLIAYGSATTPIQNSRPQSASSCRSSTSVVSIAKNSNTFTFGMNQHNFRSIIEQNLTAKKKGRPPYKIENIFNNILLENVSKKISKYQHTWIYQS